MRVLVVRPGQQGEASARRLVLRGHQPLAVPILTVRSLGTAPPADRPDALVVTSQNAAAALAAHAARFGACPVFAVGAATARAVTRAGYADVRRAGGDGKALARMVDLARPRPKTLLHVAGRDRRPEPERSLTRSGFTVAIWEVYAAERADTLPPEIAEALRAGTLDAVLHYSKRSAETLARIAAGADLADALAALPQVCLSSEVARGLEPLGSAAVQIATEPTEEALFSCLDAMAATIGKARASASPDATHGTNPVPRHSRTITDDPPPMSETRRQDPLRRAPPTIDLKAEEVGSDTAKPAATPGQTGAPPPDEGASAIEPVAATGLGADPFPSKTAPTDAPAKPADAAKPSTPSPAPATDATPSPADAKAADAKTVPDAKVGAGPMPTKPDVKADAKPSDAKPSAVSVTPTAGSTPAQAGKPGAVAGATAGAAAGAAVSESLARSGTGSVPPAGRSDKTTTAGPAPAGPAAPASKTNPAAAPVPAARAKAGIGGLLTSGLLGGVAGAVIAYLLMQSLPAKTDPAVTDRLAAAERRLATLPSGSAAPAVDGRVAALEAAVKQAGDDARAARASAEAAAKQATDASGRPAAVATPPDPALRQGLDTLSGKVDEAAKQTATNAAGLRDLGQKLADGLGAGTAAVAAVEASVRGLQAEVATAKTATGALETRSAESVRRLDALSGQTGTIAGDLAKLSPAASQAGLRIVVAGRLDEALRSGTPLAPVTTALERLGVEAPLLAPLKTYAELPAPSAGALAAEFKPLAASLTTEPAAPSESITDTLKRLAGKVVSVRAVGDGSGNDVPGLVGRIENALGRGAFTEAATTWERFPESAKRTTADWGAKLKTRAAADDAARRIGAQSLASLDAVARTAPSR